MSANQDTPRIDRLGARCIVFDEHDHVLFVGGHATAERPARWFLPGGGIDPGETPAEAARRELQEETGFLIRADALIGPVAVQRYQTVRRGAPFAQENYLFFTKAERFEPCVCGADPYELDLEFQWIPVDEFTTTEGFDYIDPLLGLVKRILGGDIPESPIRLEPTRPPGSTSETPA